MQDYLPKVLPTQYRGFPFRSRTEARWAVFFDVMEFEWQYEPEGFPCGGEGYIPDFYFPFVRMFGEVKPRELDSMEERKAQQLAAATGLSVLVLIGVPEFRAYDAIHPVYLEDGIEYERYAYSLDIGTYEDEYLAQHRLFCQPDYGLNGIADKWKALFSERYQLAILTARTFQFDSKGRF